MKLSKSLTKNINTIKQKIPSQDVIYYTFKTPNQTFCTIYIDSITDKAQVGELLIRPIYALNPREITSAKSSLQIANIF